MVTIAKQREQHAVGIHCQYVSSLYIIKKSSIL